jgi:NADH-quinone oxidoreductase subunit L
VVVTVIGAITAFFAATVGLVQNDIKRVIAYSTCSQLGYMFVALGVGAYGIGIFHLFTHAFFKALLFLGAGSVIHAMSDEQDMRNMGGLMEHIPKVTWAMMLIGTLALTGFPFTAGYFSKDASSKARLPAHGGAAAIAFWLLVIAACFTSFYSWRLIFMTFHGKPRAFRDVMNHVHESPQVMLIPLACWPWARCWRASCSRNISWATTRRCSGARRSYRSPDNNIVEEFHHVPQWVVWSPFVAMVLGLRFPGCSISANPTCRASWPSSISRSTSSCSTSGTSTSCTT